MPTQAFIDAAERIAGAHWVWLAKIDLTSPSAQTMRIASEDCRTPDGSVWESGLVSADAVRERGTLGQGLAQAVTTRIVIADREYSPFAGFTLADVQATTDFDRATVTLYLWEAGTTNAADVQEMFRGEVFDDEWDAGTLAVSLVQDAKFDVEVPNETIEKAEFPGASQFGLVKPIVLGDFKALNNRIPPFATTYGYKSDQEDAGAGEGVIPGLLVNPASGGGSTQIMYAGHELKDVLDRSAGYSHFIRAGDALAPLVPAGLSEVLGTPSSLFIAEDGLVAYVAVPCVDSNPTAGQNTASEPKNALSLDPTTYATLDEGAGKTRLVLRLGSSADYGAILSTEVVFCAVGDATNNAGSVIRAFINRPLVGDSSSSATVAGNVTVATVGRVTVGSTWNTWEADGGSQPRDLKIDFTGAGANRKARILWAVLVIKYRPNKRVVAVDDPTIRGPIYSVGGRRERRRPRPGVVTWQVQELVAGKATYETLGSFYGNVQGQPDDGSGTYTGTAGALIQRAPDMTRYLLKRYGGVANGDIETAGSTFGSFVDARDTVRDGRPGDFNLAAYIGEKVSVRGLLATAGRNARALVKRSPKNGKWQFLPQRLGQRPNFRRKLSWRDGDMVSFEAFRTSRLEIGHAFRIGYRRDHFRNRTSLECFVNSTSSAQGYANQEVPDQLQVVVTGVNDKLKWSTSAGGPYTDTLAAATYSTISLLAAVRTAMRTHVAAMHVGHGCLVVAGWNDVLDFTVGAAAYAVTMPPGYYSPDEWAALAERTLNAISGSSGRTFTVTYSHATNKFTVVASGAVILRAGTGASFATGAWPTAGFVADTASGTSFTAPIARYSRAIWFASNTGTSLTIDGTVAAPCVGLLGFEVGVSTVSAGGITELSAPLETGDRVLQAQTAKARYGSKPESAIEAEMIRNQDAAAALCHWMFDVSRRKRVGAVMELSRCPDIELGHVIELDDTLDEVRPCPGRASWANLPLLVIECDYYPFPRWRSTVKVIDIASE